MWRAVLVCFREGLEAFLIVGVMLAYLRKTGRPRLIRGVQVGVLVSVVTCIAGAYAWYGWVESETSSPNQPLYEGIAALAAALLVGGLLWQTVRAGARLKGDIETRVERAASRHGDSSRAAWGIAALTTILITREGLEAVLFVGVQAFAARALPLAMGAALGLVAAALVAWVWSRFGHRLQLGVVLRVTTLFLGLFLLQLSIYGLHELAESGVIHGTQAFHDATERLGPEGDIGQWLTFSLVLAPLLYLLLRRSRTSAALPAHGRDLGAT
jgi:high-affinity iron transporter